MRTSSRSLSSAGRYSMRRFTDSDMGCLLSSVWLPSCHTIYTILASFSSELFPLALPSGHRWVGFAHRLRGLPGRLVALIFGAIHGQSAANVGGIYRPWVSIALGQNISCLTSQLLTS